MFTYLDHKYLTGIPVGSTVLIKIQNEPKINKGIKIFKLL